MSQQGSCVEQKTNRALTTQVGLAAFNKLLVGTYALDITKLALYSFTIFDSQSIDWTRQQKIPPGLSTRSIHEDKEGLSLLPKELAKRQITIGRAEEKLTELACRGV